MHLLCSLHLHGIERLSHGSSPSLSSAESHMIAPTRLLVSRFTLPPLLPQVAPYEGLTPLASVSPPDHELS
jgi:hypothetical protein